MRSFNLFLNVTGDWISISRSDDDSVASLFPVYDENLEEGEHSQYNLSFSIVTEALIEESGAQVTQSNPLLPFLYLGAKLHLILDQKNRIDFIIKSISPQTNTHGSIYNITAQDEISFLWSKHNLGYSYSTIDDNNKLIVKDIFAIAKDILADNFIYDWTVSSYSLDANLLLEKMTLEIENSNPYNALIEACNTVGAKLVVDYYLKRLDFVRKNLLDFSGYRYTPKHSLIAYDADHSAEEMTTILHVSGGEDSSGRIVTMVPSMPKPVRNFLYTNTSNLQNWEAVLNDSFSWNEVFNAIQDTNNSYYSITNSPFVPIELYSLDRKKFLDCTGEEYYIKYNEIARSYFGHIEKDEKTVYKFKIFLDGQTIATGQPFDGDRIDDLNYQGKTYIGYSITCEEPKDTKLYIYQLKEAVEQNIYEYRRAQEDSVNTFKKIVDKIPYLGQSIIDFSPFRHAMSFSEWSELQNLINNKLRNCNIRSQYYANEFYTGASELNSLRSSFKVLGEIYGAACKTYQDFLQKSQEIDKEEQASHLEAINTADKNLESSIANSNYFNICRQLGISDTLEITNNYTQYFLNRKAEQLENIENYSENIASVMTSGEIDTMNNSNIQYYSSLREQAEQYCYNYSFNDEGVSNQGIYDRIIHHISTLSIGYELPSNNGIAYEYEKMQHLIEKEVWRPLYTNYGQYIYESSYENTDELDSVSLFNQALVYFADLNRPQSSYSLEVMDIGSLELVGIPRLYVNSLIQVYNRDSLQLQPYKDIICRVDKLQALCQIDGNNRSEEIKNLRLKLINRYKKNEPDKYSQIFNKLNLTNITHIDNIRKMYLSILDILYYDNINVVGINRVLREPLKDSVTVEQSSRYKTILSKLIKSI